MYIWFVLLIIGGYLAGSFPSAYLIAKSTRGIDIRQYGSGNVGLSNLMTVVSKRWGILVIILDLGKGFLPIFIAARLIDLPLYQQVIIGLATITGHNWPVFLGFRGGRGLLTTIGVVLVLAPWLALLLVLQAFAWIPFRQLALGTIVSMLLLPIFGWFLSDQFGFERSLTLNLGFVAVLLLTIIRRLTAPRTALSASIRPGELIINRLLFDRDTRDREAWVRQTPPDIDLKEPRPTSEQNKKN